MRARAYTVPTDAPEADGTFAWDETTIVVVHVEAGGETGLGYSYTDASVARLIVGTLASRLLPVVRFDIPGPMPCCGAPCGTSGARARRHGDLGIGHRLVGPQGTPPRRIPGEPVRAGAGTRGDLWKRRLHELRRPAVARAACRVGRAGWLPGGEDEGRQRSRARPGTHGVAKAAIGDASLFIDANGAFTPKRAIGAAHVAERGRRHVVRGARVQRRSRGLASSAPRRCRHGSRRGRVRLYPDDLCGLLDVGAVDVAQADVTRCGGYSGFLKVAALCEAAHLDLSGHCAPPCTSRRPCAHPASDTSNGSTTTSASSGCCSTGHPCRAMA